MRHSSFFFFTVLVSGGLSISIPFKLPASLQSRDKIEARLIETNIPHSAITPKSILEHSIRPRDCEEPAEPEEPSEEERRKGAKRPSRPSRPSNC
ncbi:hypothetical protein CT0861_07082 [Colletotrichum tofieldiae]|uniref:Uncharacterized protein n=1 Tax=Colletotrichum tofieldiae TaxID=708197 RepID=A0A166R6I1_9PEZI|nr:hypothetical protein CT0861_07082 [Colletotrichum tofieldiae]